MSMTNAVPAATVAARAANLPYIEWGPIIAGAIAASAVTFLLLTFGAAVGFSLVSPWPGAGVSSALAGIILTVWTVVVHVGCFAGGGYLAGRMRTRWGESVTEEGQFRDNVHGFMVWAVGVIVGTLLLASAGGAGLRVAAQSAAVFGAGVTGGISSPYDLAIDALMRPAVQTPVAVSVPPGASPPAAQADLAMQSAIPAARDDAAFRAETARIFAEVMRVREFRSDDRNYLASSVARRYSLPQAEAEKRVDAAVVRARDIEVGLRETADKARKAGILAGFLAAVSLLISCAAACAGAHMGGRDRDEGAPMRIAGSRFW